MIAFKGLILWLALALACLLPAAALASTAPEDSVWEIFNTWYDAPTTEATDLGNRIETSTSNYDTAPVHHATTEEILTEARRSFLCQNAEFKAAEETPQLVQMEFPFARGAAIQTPGVTAEGETFVRVGAAPYNLKFGSTSLSGAQPGTYAFPQATFDAIGENPAALKNLGDLPGAPPTYFRTLSPPAGTPIQRGIVPGGEFGGEGGAGEVIFPEGF